MRWGGAIAAALLVAVAVVLGVVGEGSDEVPAAEESARIVDRTALTQLEDELGHPVYWAGERPPLRIEVVEQDGGSVYLRYLPQGVAVGDEADLLTVGTYPVSNAVGALRRVAQQAGVELQRAADGAVLLPNPSSPGSVYLAYPRADIEVEVYDPAPGQALRIIRAGEIGTVGE